MEKPIIFNGEMVRAILAGRKSMTRRVIKPQPTKDNIVIDRGLSGNTSLFVTWLKNPDGGIDQDFNPEYWKCPHQKGHLLWVRETWQFRETDSGFYEFEYKDGYKQLLACWPYWLDKYNHHWHWNKWKPSIHMPKWAARLWLEIVDVRVERLQDISEEDAYSEGIEKWKSPEQTFNPIVRFHELWDSLYGKKHPWESNAWVWVIEFKKT